MTLALINILVMVLSTIMTVVLYVLSVRPEAWSRQIGPSAYPRSGHIRTLAMIFMFICMINYVIYFFFPLSIPIAQQLPWDYWLSVLIATLIAIPSSYLLVRGVLDAGEEAAVPKKEHEMYSGIYERVRHPQAWEVMIWFVLAFLLHSPFLVLYSILWLPLEYIMVMSEEKDLILRFGSAYQEYRKRTPAFFPKLVQ